MSTHLIFNARGGRRRIQVFERGPYSEGYRHVVTERAYRVTGAGLDLRSGPLDSEYWTRGDCILAAVRAYREGRPKARLVVTVCALCGTGSAPDRECSHNRCGRLYSILPTQCDRLAGHDGPCSGRL